MALGDAIGLQDKPNLFASNLNASLARQSAKDAAKEAARRKAQEKDDAEFNKITSGKDFVLDPKIWDKRYSGVASKEMEASLGKILQIRKDNPNDWHNLVNQELLGLHDRLAVHLTNNNAWKDYKQKVRSGKFVGDINSLAESEKRDYSKDVQLDPETGRMVSPEWENDNINPVYGVTSDAKGNFGGTPIPEHDYDKDLNTEIAHPSNWTDAGTTIKPSRQPNVLEITKSTRLDDAAKERIATQRSSDPNLLRYWAAKNVSVIEDGQKNGTVPTTPKEFSAWLSDQVYNETRSFLDSQRKSTVEFRNKPKDEKAAEDKTVQNVTVSSGTTVGLERPVVGKTSGEQSILYEDKGNGAIYHRIDGKFYDSNNKEITPSSEGVTEIKETQADPTTSTATAEFKPVKVQIAPEFEVIGGKGKVSSGSKSYEVGGIYKLPYLIDKNGSVIIPSDKTMKDVPNAKYQQGWFAGAVSKDGNSFIPLTKQGVEALKASKVNIQNIPENELWGQGKTASSDVKTGSQKFVVNGKTYDIPADKVEAFKKAMNIK